MTETAVFFSANFHHRASENLQRWHFQLQGIVQGVGFRPFVYRLAMALQLTGWVCNTTEGLHIETEGSIEQLEVFASKLRHEAPPHSLITHLKQWEVSCQGETQFQILDSQILEPKIAVNQTPSSHRLTRDESGKLHLGNLILPDLATCADCIRELFDPHNRRYRYPFLNCTCCGPRYSILQRLPYDRAHTTMANFAMCPNCRREYHDPLDRRFHAQPTACPDCGPQIQFIDNSIKNSPNRIPLSEFPEIGNRALVKAIELIQSGGILAVKGLGGFHLVAAADDQSAIMRLRHRKRRSAKPLAVMVPSLDWLTKYVHLEPMEISLLQSPAAPIVLIPWQERERQPVIASEVAPHNPYLGVMLPYTPLHHLLLADLGKPIVATSGNLSSETICIDEMEAITRLRDIADGFLIHNRPIARAIDDSVVRVIDSQPMILRRARGYAPLPIQLSLPCKSSDQMPTAVLGLGGHLKNTIALGHLASHRSDAEFPQWQILISQHLGDLGNSTTWQHCQQTIKTITEIYAIVPQSLGCDLHPDYGSTQLAHQLVNNSANQDLSIVPIQHHYAHVLAVMAEHELEVPQITATDGTNNSNSRTMPHILGVAWDGTGYGTDGTIWGGEFLLIPPTGARLSSPAKFPEQSSSAYRRIAHWRQFPLVGGDLASQEPRRALLGLLYVCFGADLPWSNFPALESFNPKQRSLLLTALARITETHPNGEEDHRTSASALGTMTSSVGRLFDGVAALLNLCPQAQPRINFEGQAAMQLEFSAASIGEQTLDSTYPFRVISDHDSESLIIDWKPMIKAILIELCRGVAQSQIATTFHNTLTETIVMMAQRYPASPVVLTGGCFQNSYLLSRTIKRLKQQQINVYWPQKIPCNDGGLSLGQVYGVLRHYAQIS